jgi:hypothetical protein
MSNENEISTEVKQEVKKPVPVASSSSDEDVFVPPEDVIRMYNELMKSPNAKELLAKVNQNSSMPIDVTNLMAITDEKERMQKIDEVKKRILSSKEFKKAISVCKPAKKPTKKVKIMGFAPGWVDAFRDKQGNWLQNDDSEIWCLNEFYKYLIQIPNGRATRWFEIHSRYSPSKNNAEHITWLQNCKVPVYMWEHYDDMPMSLPFPKDELCKHFGWEIDGNPVPFKYFSCQPAWMLAFAIYEGFEEIEMYGVNMATDSEFGSQRPSCEYWLGVIYGIYYANKYKERNMKPPFLPEACDLLKPPGGKLYGFDTDNQARLLVKTRLQLVNGKAKKFNSQLNQASQAVQNSQMALAEMRGAKNAYDDLLKHIL